MDVRISKNFTIMFQEIGKKVDQGLEEQTQALTQHMQKLEQFTTPQSARLPIVREEMVA